MAKATVLTPDALSPSANVPLAATPARASSGISAVKPAPSTEKAVPLQVRWPRQDVKAIKVAAAQSEQTISEYMLACFHAYIKA